MADYQSQYTGAQIDSALTNTLDLVESIKLALYPVGSIYMSVESTDPSTFIGGTWERLQDRFLLGAGSTYANGTTGGSATMAHTHTLSHTHTLAHTHTLSHTHTLPHTHTLSHTHTLAHTHTLSHTHTMAHTHTEGDLAAAIGATANDAGSISYQAGSRNSRGPASVANYTLWGSSWSSSSRSFNHHTRVYGTTSGSSAANTGGASTSTTSGASTTTTSGASVTTTSDASTTKTSDASATTTSGASVTKTSDASATTTSAASNTNNMPPYLVVYMWKRTA